MRYKKVFLSQMSCFLRKNMKYVRFVKSRVFDVFLTKFLHIKGFSDRGSLSIVYFRDNSLKGTNPSKNYKTNIFH